MSWKKYFKVVPNNITNLPVQQSQTGETTNSKYSSFLPEIYAGHPNRIQRYYQYDDMDRDSDVNAAIDTIADFCTQSEEQNDEPFLVHYNDDANETEVKLIKSYLTKWSKLNNFHSRLWNIFRGVIKAGDQFFLRDPETKEWLWIDHYNVEMVKVDDKDGKEPTEYIIRGLDYNKRDKFATKTADTSQYQTPFGPANTSSRSGAPNMGNVASQFVMAGGQRDIRSQKFAQPGNNELIAIDAKHVVHLSLSVGMDMNWPFGQSVLDPIYKTYKQKELLEDATIIYRVQRAPERRMFHIDVGSMPPQKAKAYIEQVKNEIHQRRIPNRNGSGGSVLDASYNPLSILDDFFFACMAMDTKIALLDGRDLTLQEVIDEYKAGKENFVYSLNTETHEFEPGKITWADITRKNAQLLRVTLDNGEYVDVTPDHRFILRDGSEIQAQYLTEGASLMPLYLMKNCTTGPNQKIGRYTRIRCNATGKSPFLHLVVSGKPKGRDTVAHHIDFNPYNNNPTNLVVMDADEHTEFHKIHGTYSLQTQWNDPVARDKLVNGINEYHKTADKQMLSERNKLNGSSTWKKYDRISYTEEMFDRMNEIFQNGYRTGKEIRAALDSDIIYRKLFEYTNANVIQRKGINIGGKLYSENLDMICMAGGYENWSDYKTNKIGGSKYRNHKVVSVEILPDRADTGDITVESVSNSHVFALTCGIYVHNSSSEGRGSRVEILPGGESGGEILDLSYFAKKMARGLRIPTSYLAMGGEENNTSYNDGKLGAALIQEFRFNKYCMRLQSLLNPVFDTEFKLFLKENSIEIENDLFELRFNPPQNFTKYRQIELDAQQAGVYSQVADNKKLAERFKFKRFLNLTEEELLENEEMWREENADRIAKKTGATPESMAGDQSGLGSVGVRPTDDFGGEGDLDFGDDAPVEGGDETSPEGGPTGAPQSINNTPPAGNETPPT